MSVGDPDTLTFALLDKQAGVGDLDASNDESSLEAWYRSVRDIPIAQLSLGDICKACRQRVHLEYVLPVAWRFLEEDPGAGTMYEGELLASLVPVPSAYWMLHPADSAVLGSILERAQLLDIADLEGDLSVLRGRVSGRSS